MFLLSFSFLFLILALLENDIGSEALYFLWMQHIKLK